MFAFLISPFLLFLCVELSARIFSISLSTYTYIPVNLTLLLPLSFSHLFNSHHILDCRRLFLYKSRLISATLCSMHVLPSSHIRLLILSTFLVVIIRLLKNKMQYLFSSKMSCVHLHRPSKSNIVSDLHYNIFSCVIRTVIDRVGWQEDVRSLLPQIVEIATVTLFGCLENKGLRKSAICLLAACARLNRTYREICLQVTHLSYFVLLVYSFLHSVIDHLSIT